MHMIYMYIHDGSMVTCTDTALLDVSSHPCNAAELSMHSGRIFSNTHLTYYHPKVEFLRTDVSIFCLYPGFLCCGKHYNNQK